MKYDAAKGCWRAEKGDAEYGHVCPDCPNLKDDQALACMECYRARRYPDIVDRRICECGEPKSATRERCRSCASRRQVFHRDELGQFASAA